MSKRSKTETRKPTRHLAGAKYLVPEGAKPNSNKIREDRQLSLFREDGSGCTDGSQTEGNRYRSVGTREKILGAVFTPPRVAAALTRWAVRSKEDVVLDPSCGEGVFLSAARTRLGDLGGKKPRCLGIDIDPSTATKAGVECADFFEWVTTASKVDVIVGNPPFVRSHLFPEPARALALRAMKGLGLRPSRLMSTWAPFLVLSCGLLNNAGRLAMVIPEELLAVGYAEEIRRFLLKWFRRVIVCLPGADIFPNVQQAVVLLLCDSESRDESGLFSIDFTALEEGDYGAVEPAPTWEWNSKWTHLFLTASERERIADLWPTLGWKPFREYGQVEVGIVTGDNGFFIVRQSDAHRFQAHHLVPVVSSTRDLRGVSFNGDDFRYLVRENRPAFLLNLSEPKHLLCKEEKDYLEEGEREHVSERYKCRIRSPWYAVPGIWDPNAALFRQAGEIPRLVHLGRKCTVTDTIHRVTWIQPSRGKRHAVGFTNTWTLLAAELTGRSYGGGVLEIMPSEANALPIPEPLQTLEEVFEEVDERVRSRAFFDAVHIVDEVVTPPWISQADREIAHNVLRKLVNRRKTRITH
jgi:adenine-specific DNA-methyltransferase